MQLTSATVGTGVGLIAYLALAAAAFAFAVVATALLRRYALRQSLLDVPNARSSHTVPTPRGGGGAIAVAVLAAVAGLTAAGRLDPWYGCALFVGGALVAAAGWIDDRRSLSARARLVAHLLAASVVVAAVGGFPSFDVGGSTVHVGALGAPVAVLAIVWATNLYNFMDGIDGIAGGQAVAAGVGGAAVLWLGGSHALSLVSAVVAAASFGFLVWNWPPARIFMGDVGSGFLGFLFASIAVGAERSDAAPALLWPLMLGAFVFDATLTLVRRAVRRERLAEAHRSHAYQRIVQAGWSHRRASGAALAIAGVLAVLAVAVAADRAPLAVALAAGSAICAAAYLGVEARRAAPRARAEGGVTNR